MIISGVVSDHARFGDGFVSVIIPVYNDLERLDTCLEALAKQTYGAREVIVVDNGSSDPASSLSGKHPSVRFEHEGMRGSYAARNRGIEAARGDILAFTDSDCIPAPDWLERGVRALRGCGDCGIVAGKVDVFLQNEAAPTAFERLEQIFAFPQDTYVRKGRFGVTANIFTTRRVVDAVGPFDATLQSGGDFEWGQRVSAAGFSVQYAPDVVVLHPARADVHEVRKKIRRMANGAFSRDPRWRSILRYTLRYSLPPMRQIQALWSSEYDMTTGEKWRVLAALLYTRCLRSFEMARLGIDKLWSRGSLKSKSE